LSAKVAEGAARDGTAGKIVHLREEHRALVSKRVARGAGRAMELLERLYFRPIVSVHSIREMTGLSFASANDLAKRLSDWRLLSEIMGRGRNRRFSYAPYLALFGDTEGGVSPPRQFDRETKKQLR